MTTTARATLIIDGDASALRRALGEVPGAARRAQAAMSSEARRGAATRVAVTRSETRETERAARDAARARIAAEKATQRAARESASAAASLDRQRSRALLSQHRQHVSAMMSLDRQRHNAMMAQHRAQQTLTRQLARQEQREAGRFLDRSRRSALRGAGRMGSAGAQFASTAHEAIQSERERRAGSEHTLNAAFYQAGIGGAEARAMRSRLQREVASGALRGLSLDEVSEGLMAAQTQFSVLSGDNAAARGGGFERQLQLLRFARNTYQSPGEVLRVAGMLQQQGVTGADQETALRSMTGMAQAGAIELSDVVSQGLGPLMQNIARSVRSGMTAAERAAAVRAATLETMAVAEVTSRGGQTPRDALNALSKTRASITNERTQANLYARLQSAGPEGVALAQRMFTGTGPAARLREGTTAVGFLSDLVAGFGGDTNRVTNLLGAGGPTRPMVLDSQQRRLLTVLASQTQGGGTIADTVRSMQTQGGGFGAADEARGAAMRDVEQQTQLRSAEETRANALTDNTNQVVNLSNSIRDWNVRHPWLAQAGTAAAPIAGSVAAPVVARAAPTLLSRVLPFLANVHPALRVAAAGAAAYGLYRAVSGGRQEAAANLVESVTPVSVSRGGGAAAAAREEALRSEVRALPARIAGALREQPLQATVAPHDAAQAASQTASQRPRG